MKKSLIETFCKSESQDLVLEALEDEDGDLERWLSSRMEEPDLPGEVMDLLLAIRETEEALSRVITLGVQVNVSEPVMKHVHQVARVVSELNETMKEELLR